MTPLFKVFVSSVQKELEDEWLVEGKEPGNVKWNLMSPVLLYHATLENWSKWDWRINWELDVLPDTA